MSSEANLPILVILILLVGSSLFCIGADKGLHDFSMKKEVTLIILLLEHCSSFVTGLLTLYAVGHRNKVHVAFVLCWLLILESYISFRLVQCVVALPKVIQWSFPHRRDLTLKACSSPTLWMPCFVLHGMFLKA